MRASDILSDFQTSAFTVEPKATMREGIFSDVYGTLIKHGKLNEPYYDFLLWCVDQGVPVTLMSSEPKRATRELGQLGVSKALLKTMTNKMDIAGSAYDDEYEAIVDDNLMLVQTGIYINPDSFAFRKFLTTSLYKNRERSRPEGLRHLRAQ